MICSLNDKKTYNSIISQIWLLQLMLLAGEGKVLYELKSMTYMIRNPQDYFVLITSDFERSLIQHNQTQLALWQYYRDVGDIILPDEDISVYSTI